MPIMLERGISLPAALTTRRAAGLGGWGPFRSRVAVSCSPGALQLLAAADHAQQMQLIRSATTDDDAASSLLGASLLAPSQLGASAVTGGSTPPGLRALGLGTPFGFGQRVVWSPGAAAQEMLASFRKRRGAHFRR